MTFIHNCTVLATDLRSIIVTIVSYYKDGYIGTVIILVFNRIKKSAVTADSFRALITTPYFFFISEGGKTFDFENKPIRTNTKRYKDRIVTAVVMYPNIFSNIKLPI